MSKKNIIIAIVFLVVIVSLLVVYKSNYFFKENINESVIPNEEYIDESSDTILDEENVDKPSHESRRQSTEISDEACIEINAYVLRMTEIIIENGYLDPRIIGLNEKVKELEKEYGVDSESDYFIDYCNNRYVDESVMERIQEKMRELGSDIE